MTFHAEHIFSSTIFRLVVDDVEYLIYSDLCALEIRMQIFSATLYLCRVRLHTYFIRRTVLLTCLSADLFAYLPSYI
jgi:hypothetical protein